MLISQDTQGEAHRRQGRSRDSLAGLRRQLANPSTMSDGNRQRLRELARRVARIRCLGDEYVGVGLSEWSAAALCGPAATA